MHVYSARSVGGSVLCHLIALREPRGRDPAALSEVAGILFTSRGSRMCCNCELPARTGTVGWERVWKGQRLKMHSRLFEY